MNELTSEQQDALIELGNIGMSKAAKQLSILLNSPIKITIPQISLKHIEQVEAEAFFNNEGIYTFIAQSLSKDLEGFASLMFRREHGNILITNMVDAMPEFTAEEVRACEQEAMLEIGNIIITSCLSVIANMTSKSILLTEPVYYEDKVKLLLNMLCAPLTQQNKNIFVITTELKTFNDKLSAHLFIVLKESSAQSLLTSIKTLLRS